MWSWRFTAAAYTPSRNDSSRCSHASTDPRNTHGYTDQHAGKISEREARDVLEGRLPDGTEVPVYPFKEFKRGIGNLPIRYGVILDFELARQSLRGYEAFDVLKDDPNMIVRAGGVAANAAYLDRFQARPQYETDGPLAPVQPNRSESATDESPVPGRQPGRLGNRGP